MTVNSIWPLLPIYLTGASSLLYGSFRKKIDPKGMYNPWLRLVQFFVFLIIGIVLLQGESTIRSLSLFLWAGICLALYASEKYVFGQPTLKIGADGLQAPVGFSYKKISWDRLEHVVVRQDYITLNYINNRYLQFEIKDLLTGTEIEQINRYCEEKVRGKKELGIGN